MESDDEGVWTAARTIRPYLADLVGEDAGHVDRQIADQLNGAADRPTAVIALRAVLGADEDTLWFLREVLRDAPQYRPPFQQPRYLQRQAGGIASPAGDPAPILYAGMYECPQGDYVWYRPEVGSPVPDCPTHHAALIRA